MPLSPVPSSGACSLGFGLTEHQAWGRKMGLRFEKAVRAFFSKTVCNQISQNRNQANRLAGGCPGNSDRTKPEFRNDKATREETGESASGACNGSPWWPRPRDPPAGWSSAKVEAGRFLELSEFW